jgi:2-methylcitrate dehydratase PrpD
MVHLTRLLAEHALSIDFATLPGFVRQRTLDCILDLMTAAIAGRGSQAPEAALSTAGRLYGDGPAPVWFTGTTSSLLCALLHNGLCASALDLDDGNRDARGHPGASVIPAVLTLAAVTPDVSAQDMLAAVVAGYDVGVRIAASQKPDALPSRQTGRWAAFAAAAAVGRLLGAEVDPLAQALAIAGVLAPNQRANGSSGYSRVTGNLVKEGIAFSAGTGVQALCLGQAGFSGPIDLLDHHDFYDQDRLLADLGDRFEISQTYFKLYACCRYIHPALDAARALLQAHRIPLGEIAAIVVETFQSALRLANSCDPENLTALQYSLPYCLAVLILAGEEALAPAKPGLLKRPDIITLASKVTLRADQEAEARFPAETCARLTIVLHSGVEVSSRMTAARGDPRQPLDRQTLEEKFLSVTTGSLNHRRKTGLLDALDLLDAGNATALLAFLAAGPGSPAQAGGRHGAHAPMLEGKGRSDDRRKMSHEGKEPLDLMTRLL